MVLMVQMFSWLIISLFICMFFNCLMTGWWWDMSFALKLVFPPLQPWDTVQPCGFQLHKELIHACFRVVCVMEPVPWKSLISYIWHMKESHISFLISNRQWKSLALCSAVSVGRLFSCSGITGSLNSRFEIVCKKLWVFFRFVLPAW